MPPPRQEASGGATEVTWGAGTRWPAAVPIASLPPLASRLGFRALPARLAYTAATNARVLLLLIAIGASPLWAGYGLSQLGSFYAIPSASMEATLRIGDVVFAEKASRWLARDTLEVGDLVLFRAPPGLQKLVAEAGGRPIGSRDLFVKRVAAVAGDVVELLDDGGVAVNGKPRTLPPNACSDDIGNGAGAGTAGIRRPRTVPEDEVFVLGDCPARSTDSRSWGTLPLDNVVARPVVEGHTNRQFGFGCNNCVATGQERRHLVREGESVCHSVSVTRIPTLSLLDLLRRTAWVRRLIRAPFRFSLWLLPRAATTN